MTKLEQIEKSVAELNKQEFEAFSTWFEALLAERWDRQMEKDVASGKLDHLAEKAFADFHAGKTRRL
ncbi:MULTISPECIES: hypothetical protein [Rhizobium]|uniref:Uncharacterized protein n=1 Tax=Rhizobium laguerreae TaxID=1076926 RepID=A0A6N9ZMY4_9HYPH|nr:MULTISPECIES: hypothetical protein [Rhizobium]NEH94646.1 hypothetical protein [Rhizobium laguerreae]NKK68582.1 hypothetical protein [Rhizobium leguminosarum bv. viciae]NKL10088.1 hypothetical protein [Rhizobium leguminosarum bv. viciae]NKL87082.1 hypothetical protein [Rhizobium leguminosarum bv. viciae]NKL95290.1 hypothetical protein [Rhizobium leguminosarum bv. viciae]